MTLEQQVVSLELAKRLKELGVKQDQSLFWWTGSDGYYEIKTTPWAMGNGINLSQQIGETYAAFTVAELGQLLPWRSKRVDTVNNTEPVFTKLHNGTDIFVCAYWDEDSDHLYGGMKVRFDDENEANSRAKMLIYLLENKLMAL